jgi:hypothetical protein
MFRGEGGKRIDRVTYRQMISGLVLSYSVGLRLVVPQYY